MSPRVLTGLVVAAFTLAATGTIVGLWQGTLDTTGVVLAWIALIGGLTGGQVLRGVTGTPAPPEPTPPGVPAPGPGNTAGPEADTDRAVE